MAIKKSPPAIQEEKKLKIEKLFTAAQPYLHHPEKIKDLKENSSLKAFCKAALLYLQADAKEGCIRIYELLRIRPFRKKDIPLTELVKRKLRDLKHPPSPAQLTCF